MVMIMAASCKHCPRCNTDLPLDAFHHDASTADQRTVYCRVCRNSMTRDWYDRHRDERTGQIEKWKREHADEVRAADAARKKVAFETDPQFRATKRQRDNGYNAAHRQDRAEQNRTYRAANAQQINARRRARRAAQKVAT